MKDKVIFKKLDDLNRLSEIYSITYDAFYENGDIPFNKKKMINSNPHLDNIEETIVIIAELNNKIIATNTLTKDGKNGLHTDKYFKIETDELRRKYKNIGSTWRIVTKDKENNNIKLIKNLIDYSNTVASEMDIKYNLFIVKDKHENVYKNLVNAKTIAKKRTNMQSSEGKEVNLVLMIAETSFNIS